MATSLSLFGALLTLVQVSYTQDIIYVSPKPNSTHHPRETNIVVRFSRNVTPDEFARIRMQVRGSATKDHDGKLFLSDDLQTIIFNPAQEFAPEEVVEVGVARGSPSRFYSFSFTISPPSRETENQEFYRCHP